MKLKDIRQKFNRKKQKELPEILVQEKIINPTKNEDLTVEEQAEKIIGILKQYPEYREAIVRKVAEAKEIPQAVVDKSAEKAVDSPEVSDKIAASLAKEASDETTLYVLKESEIPTNTGIAIKDTLDKEESKEEAACILLRKLYESLNDVEVQDKLAERIKKIIEESDRTDEVNRELYKVIAKNFAIMYHKINKAMGIYPMEKIVPLDEMMRAKMPQKIEEEYINLLKDREKNVFNKEEVTDIFLDKIAQESSEKAKKQGKTVDLFSPSNLGNLTDKEIDNYLNFLRKYNSGITDMARENIRDRLKGQEQEGYTIDQFIATVRDLPEGEGRRYITILSKLSNREMDTVAQCIESGFIENLSKKKVEERDKYLKAINQSMREREIRAQKIEKIKRTNIVSKNETPKVKKAQLKGDIIR